MDANHCPGAVLLLFKVDAMHYYLHTGDFRYHPSMKSYAPLDNIVVEGLYLDTTFCDHKYTFPSQQEAIESIMEIVKKEMNSRNLFLIGTYTIGKERILIAICNTFHVKLFVSREKYAILSLLDIDMSLFTTDCASTNFHVVSMGMISFESMQKLKEKSFHNKYDQIIGIQPTGWSFGKSVTKVTKRQSKSCTIYGVPYSEHSSYNELLEFVSWIKPKRIIPTVDCSTPQKVKKILSHFDTMSSRRSTLLPFLEAGINKVLQSITLFHKEGNGNVCIKKDSTEKENQHHNTSDHNMSSINSTQENYIQKFDKIPYEDNVDGNGHNYSRKNSKNSFQETQYINISNNNEVSDFEDISVSDQEKIVSVTTNGFQFGVTDSIENENEHFAISSPNHTKLSLLKSGTQQGFKRKRTNDNTLFEKRRNAKQISVKSALSNESIPSLEAIRQTHQLHPLFKKQSSHTPIRNTDQTVAKSLSPSFDLSNSSKSPSKPFYKKDTLRQKHLTEYFSTSNYQKKTKEDLEIVVLGSSSSDDDISL